MVTEVLLYVSVQGKDSIYNPWIVNLVMGVLRPKT